MLNVTGCPTRGSRFVLCTGCETPFCRWIMSEGADDVWGCDLKVQVGGGVVCWREIGVVNNVLWGCVA